ncbi:hypothetical protein TRICI_001826 [Trichomonascus ciferrii]|uniref:NADH dehydrogenase [ubiquinone] 1 alpha subcomplex subunit 13 n=1 Tax=Trichomonascus ciferrii TaxID=44093 RepID=A0A642V874_9ASCO|nr:hypothetical protein TRICI_001826 [Trichomonascus ciferrii]
MVSQDLPPAKGYEPIQWKVSFRPSIYAAAVLGFSAWGFYKLVAVIRERNELARERAWSRIYLQPVLEAEADRDAVRRHFSALAKEKEIMKDVEGWDPEESVYNDKKFRRPTYISLPKF